MGYHGAFARFFPWQHRPSPSPQLGDVHTYIHTAISVWEVISGLQTFLSVPARCFARHAGCSYPRSYIVSSCEFYIQAHPGKSPYPCYGYASRPNQSIDGTRTLTSPDSRPCRLLRGLSTPTPCRFSPALSHRPPDTKNFPKNRHAKSGDRMKIIITDIQDKGPVNHVIWFEDDYRKVFWRA